MAETFDSSQPFVGILTGSPNDLPKVEKVRDTLDELGISSKIVIASAHRTPDKVFTCLERAHARNGVYRCKISLS